MIKRRHIIFFNASYNIRVFSGVLLNRLKLFKREITHLKGQCHIICGLRHICNKHGERSFRAHTTVCFLYDMLWIQTSSIIRHLLYDIPERVQVEACIPGNRKNGGKRRRDEK